MTRSTGPSNRLLEPSRPAALHTPHLPAHYRVSHLLLTCSSWGRPRKTREERAVARFPISGPSQRNSMRSKRKPLPRCLPEASNSPGSLPLTATDRRVCTIRAWLLATDRADAHNPEIKKWKEALLENSGKPTSSRQQEER